MSELITRKSSLERRLSAIEKEAIAKVTTKCRRRSISMMYQGAADALIVELPVPEEAHEIQRQLEQYDKTDKRALKCMEGDVQCERTARRIYKRMKADGLIKESAVTLFRLLHDIDPRIAYLLSNHGKSIDERSPNYTITKEAWTLSILQTLLFYCRSDLSLLNNYFPDSEEEWKDFYVLTVINLLYTLTLHLSVLIQVPEMVAEEVSERLLRVQDELEKEHPAVLPPDNTQAQEQLRVAQEENRQAMRALSADYNKIVKRQAEEIKRLHDKLSLLEPDICEKENSDKSQLYLELPERGVSFVAAHPNTMSKLKEMHPKWDFIPVGTMPSRYPNNPVCFVNVSYMGHKQWLHVKANCSSLLIPCNASNMERLNAELLQSYNMYLDGRIKEPT